MPESIAETLMLITRLLSDKSGRTVVLGGTASNLLIQTAGGEQSARSLLAQICSSTQTPLVWRLLYDADPGWYFLNVEPVK
jgi:hypothetical protein